MSKWSAWINSEEGAAKVLVGLKSVTILFRCQEDGHRKGLKNAVSVTILLKKAGGEHLFLPKWHNNLRNGRIMV